MKFFQIQFVFLLINICLCAGGILYRGTLCGWAESDTDKPILCNGFDPRHSCPQHYTREIYSSGLAHCVKSNTSSTDEYGLAGTICGGLARNPCGEFIPNEKCPPGYIQDFRFVCYKNATQIEDLLGTFCGVISEGRGTTCNNSKLGECPQGYKALNFEEMQWYACVKE